MLTSQPTADVTVPIASSSPTEGTVSPASLTFTAAAWSTPQTVTVTGVDDSVADGTRPYTVVIGPATSGDPLYAALLAPSLSFTNTDDDVAGITLGAPSGTTTSEAGTSVTFTVVLTVAADRGRDVAIASSNTTEGTVSPASLTFTAANWNTPQTVTVTGADDFNGGRDAAYTIAVGPATSGDANYNGLDRAEPRVHERGRRRVGHHGRDADRALHLRGGRPGVTFTVVLTSQPTADVTIPIASSNTRRGHGLARER